MAFRTIKPRSTRSPRSPPIAARSACRRAASSSAAGASIARASRCRASFSDRHPGLRRDDEDGGQGFCSGKMRQRAYIRPMTRTITVAALQLPLPGPVEPNIEAVSALVEEAAAKGAQVILPPELFEGPYFCQVEDEELFATARPTDRTSTRLNSSH